MREERLLANATHSVQGVDDWSRFLSNIMYMCFENKRSQNSEPKLFTTSAPLIAGALTWATSVI